MDVLSLRKTKGTVEGEVRLNGHLQDKNTFKRCAGKLYSYMVRILDKLIFTYCLL